MDHERATLPVQVIGDSIGWIVSLGVYAVLGFAILHQQL
jgi:hypothetical protein